MKIQDAIKKINEMGFNTNLWEKGGKKRIYVNFTASAIKKEAGFIGSDKTEIESNFSVRRSAPQKSKDFYADKNEKLAQIANFQIEWNTASVSQEEKNAYRVGAQMLHDHHFSSKAEQDRIINDGGWELTHDL